MTEHYYSQKPLTKSEPKTWEVKLRSGHLKFTSDHGVFSKGGVDFGTKLLLETFRFPDIEGALLDVGCGYGVIGLTLAEEKSSLTINMIDVNGRAVHLAKQNAVQNHIENVQIFESNLFSNLAQGQFAAILSNPPIRAGKQVVHQLFEEARDWMLPGGELWIVIQKKQGAPSAIKKLESIYGKVCVMSKKKGYNVICAQKI